MANGKNMECIKVYWHSNTFIYFLVFSKSLMQYETIRKCIHMLKFRCTYIIYTPLIHTYVMLCFPTLPPKLWIKTRAPLVCCHLSAFGG